MPYIDVEKLIGEMKSLSEQDRLEFIGVYDCIKSQPSADVVEVTRCKNCNDCEILDEDSYYCSYFNKNVDKNDYCSYGG